MSSKANPESENRKSKRGGFTLIEVLLAMAILAVVMTVIYTSFSTAGRNVQQAETLRDETDTARALITRLSVDIENVYKTGDPLTFIDGKKEELDGDNGEKIRHDGISMTTLTNWPRPGSKETELWEVGYFFKEKPEGKGYTLFRREKRELSKDEPPREGGIEYEITDQVKSLQFRYSADGSTWEDNGWENKPGIPKMVEIVVTLNSGKVYAVKAGVGKQFV
jgi:prepilin-type N-terminal cleavage/methylation domain-containing protein